jgi:hypothetical protein
MTVNRNESRKVGFGDQIATPPTTDRTTAIITLGGLTGAAVGAVLGYRVDKTAGGAIGAVIGGAGVGLIAYGVAESIEDERPLPAVARDAWHPLGPSDLLQAGTQVAVAVSTSSGFALSQDVIDKINAVLTLTPNTNTTVYGPGTRLPAGWPTDDNAGPNAFRYMTDILVAQAATAFLQAVPPQIATIKAWARSNAT